LQFLIKSVSPLLSFTAEESYAHLKEPRKQESVFLSGWPSLKDFKDPQLEKKFSLFLELRDKVLKALEEKRAFGVIGSSLEARVVLGLPQVRFEALTSHEEVLREMFIVSSVSLVKADEFSVRVEKASGAKCGRCWNYRETVGKDPAFKEVCLRCADALKKQA
jgi:isoleucyl-tRNA synthetase